MQLSLLTALSPLDGRYHEKMTDLRDIFSEFGLIKFRVMVEIHWLLILTEQANLPELNALTPEAKQHLESLVENFTLADAARVKEIESEINHDVKAVEYFIKEKMGSHNELLTVSEFIHFGCTSEDINNLAYGLMLLTARKQCLLPTLDKLIEHMKQFAHDYADLPMLSRTHGQPASPTTLGKEIANFAARIQRQLTQLQHLVLLGKMNGATGNYNALAIAYPSQDWQALSQTLVTTLGLDWNPYTTQIEPHDYMSELFSLIARINTILLDFNRDMWGYIAINYLKQKSLANEVGSSTMPHKINPIDFENAEGNLGIANALFDYMIAKLPISRWQRDLSDSTVLRNIGVAIGHSLLAYQSTLKGLSKLAPNEDVIAADLENHWEILGEAIQTIMRRYGLAQPYEQLKAFTRGRQIDKIAIQQFINALALPEQVKNQLLALKPADYIGYAEMLAKQV